VHRATIRVLQHNGCDVIVPHDQTCCGALHRHGGRLDEARKLLRRNARAFAAADIDAVVVNAAGCGASLKEPIEGPADGQGEGASRGEARRTPEEPAVPYRDVFEFLHALGLTPPTRAVPQRVVYDPPCHLLHAQRVVSRSVTGQRSAPPTCTPCSAVTARAS